MKPHILFIIFIAASFSYLFSYVLLHNSDRLKWGKKAYVERVKLHKKSIPRLGGVVLYSTLYIILAAIFILKKHFMYLDTKKIIGFFLASSLVFGIGFYDDLIKRSSYKIKFMLQILAGIILALSGYSIKTVSMPFAPDISVGIFGPVFIVLWVVLIMNAINLIDGLDGLAAGISLIIGTGFFIIAVIRADYFMLVMLSFFLGAILGFFKYNFYPAKLFLGDSGSLFLGLTLAVVAIEISIKRLTIISLAIPMLIMLIPILSIGFTFMRRLIMVKNPFNADTMHLHYRLIRAGMLHRDVVLVFYAATSACMLLGLACYFTPPVYELVTIIIASLMMLGLYAWALYFINSKKAHRKIRRGRHRSL